MGEQTVKDKILLSDNDALLSADGLACMRGGRLLFSKCSFTLNAGEILHLKGANGIGKSSLLRMLAGLLPVFHGQFRRAGEIGLSDGQLPLDLDQTLMRALDFWQRLDGRTGTSKNQAFALLDLEPLADVPVRIFSTGQRKRAALAMIALQNASVWLLDEPANGLDSRALTGLAGLMAHHCLSGGGVVIASHQYLPAPAEGYPSGVTLRSLDLSEFAT